MQLKDIDCSKLTVFISVAKMCVNEKCPYVIIDYRKNSNPYKAKFGDEWLNAIDESVGLSPYVCVTDLIDHIIKESQKIMNGTMYEKNWYFYHDALSLMTANQAREWMEKQKHGNKTYLERWLLPFNGMNRGTQYKFFASGELT